MDVLEILKEVLEDEKAGAERYRKLAEEMTDAESRAIFEALAREEDNHYRTVRERMTALKLRRQKG